MWQRFWKLLSVNWCLGRWMMLTWVVIDLGNACLGALALLMPRWVMAALRVGAWGQCCALIFGLFVAQFVLAFFDRLTFCTQHLHQQSMNFGFLASHLRQLCQTTLSAMQNPGFYDDYALLMEQSQWIYMNVQTLFRQGFQLLSSLFVTGTVLWLSGPWVLALVLTLTALRFALRWFGASWSVYFDGLGRPFRRRINYLTQMTLRSSVARDMALPKRRALLFDLYDQACEEQMNILRRRWLLRLFAFLGMVLDIVDQVCAPLLIGLRIFAKALPVEEFFVVYGAYQGLGATVSSLISMVQSLRTNDLYAAQIEALPLRYPPDRRPLLKKLESITVEDVCFGYQPEQWVLKGVNFSWKKGEKLALVGPNGSGKSTLLALLVGLYQPQRGKVTYNDHLTSVEVNARQCLGLGAQRDSLYPFTIEENIAFGPLNSEWLDRAIEEWKPTFDPRPRLHESLSPLLAKEGGEVSGGQGQTLVLLRALYEEPNWLILDEPTEGLDEVSRKNFCHALSQHSGSVLVITHDRQVVESVDRVIELSLE